MGKAGVKVRVRLLALAPEGGPLPHVGVGLSMGK